MWGLSLRSHVTTVSVPSSASEIVGLRTVEPATVPTGTAAELSQSIETWLNTRKVMACFASWEIDPSELVQWAMIRTWTPWGLAVSKDAVMVRLFASQDTPSMSGAESKDAGRVVVGLYVKVSPTRMSMVYSDTSAASATGTNAHARMTVSTTAAVMVLRSIF